MGLLEELHRQEDEIATVGYRIRDEARRAGAPFSYVDPAVPDVIVIENADGSRYFKPVDRHPVTRKVGL